MSELIYRKLKLYELDEFFVASIGSQEEADAIWEQDHTLYQDMFDSWLQEMIGIGEILQEGKYYYVDTYEEDNRYA